MNYELYNYHTNEIKSVYRLNGYNDLSIRKLIIVDSEVYTIIGIIEVDDDNIRIIYGDIQLIRNQKLKELGI
jgi:hypothetical protein